jgi:deoxyuridine 5'-triphosphate nucleotidohydrolase
MDIPWLIFPNLIASYMLMRNKAFEANLIYSFGYILLIWHNIKLGDSSQIIYFTILEIMSIVGIFLYLYYKEKRLSQMDDIDRILMNLITADNGLYINGSGFPDQLSKKNKFDAGLDVKAVLQGIGIETVIYGPTGETYAVDVEDIIIPAKGRACINACIITQIPEDCYGQLASRSGLSKNYGLEVGAGVIDSSYRGLISVVLFNHGFQDYTVKHGQKIAQLITIKINNNPYIQVSELGDSTRGSNGFGSSGR